MCKNKYCYMTVLSASLLLALTLVVRSSKAGAPKPTPAPTPAPARTGVNVARGHVQKVSAPRAVTTTIGAALANLNRGYSGEGTFILVSDANNNPIPNSALVSGSYPNSMSVNQAFGPTFTQGLPASQSITLLTDPTLIRSMQANNQLPSTASNPTAINAALNRVFLYFLYPVNGVTYRFYLNDPCPAPGISLPQRPTAYPALEIINAFDTSG